MDFEQILTLIDHVSSSRLESFCYESGNLKLTLNNKIPPVIVPGIMGENSGSVLQDPIQTVMEKMQENQKSSTKNKVETDLSDSVTAHIQGQMAQQVPASENADPAPVSNPELSGDLVKSPLVGTFYTAPSEDAPAFVKIGDKVKKGQVLAIVEAMKLMNDIESDFDGEIAEIYVKNGQPVEYGQPLFMIR